jgi:hypothetical protein
MTAETTEVPSNQEFPPPPEAAVESRIVTGRPARELRPRKNLGGRPRKPPPSPGDKPPPAIVAPHFKYGWDSPAGRRPNDFFTWSGSLNGEQKQRLLLYGYRLYPVGRSLSRGKDGKDRATTQIFKVAGEDIYADLEAFKRQWGSGDYMLLLNEQVHQHKTVARCQIRITEMQEYPPVIPDLGWLDLSIPANKSFIDSLRLRGVEIPGDPERRRDHEQEEADEMVNAQAVEALTGTVERLSDRVIKSAEERAQQERPAPVGSTVQDQAQVKVVEIMSKAALDSIELVRDSMRANERPRTSPVAELKEIVDVVRDVATAIRPEKDSSPGVLMELFKTAMGREADLNTKLQSLQAAQIASLEARMDRLLVRLETAQAQPTATPNQSLLGQLKEMGAVKEALRDFLGLEEEEGPAARGPRAPSLLESLVAQAPAILQGLGSLASSAAAAWHNAAVARTGQGTPIAVPISLPEAEAPQGELSAAAVPAPEQSAAEQARQTQAAQLSAIRQAIDELKAPLLLALNEGQSGDGFAQTLIEFRGRIAYEQLHGLGRDGIIVLLQTYAPDVWRVVVAMPERFESFVREFLNADELIAQREAEEEAGLEARDVPADLAAAAAQMEPGQVRRVVARSRDKAGV